VTRRSAAAAAAIVLAACNGSAARPDPAPAPEAPAPVPVPAAQAAAGPTLVTDPNLPSDDPSAVWLVQAVTERPRMLRPVPLVYPDSLKRRGIGGDAVVEFVVDTLGRVEPEIRVIETAHPGLAEPARATIRPARFQPGHVRGRKVRVLMTLRFHFAPAQG
jgi:TonB family protein